MSQTQVTVEMNGRTVLLNLESPVGENELITVFDDREKAWHFMEACDAKGLKAGYPGRDSKNGLYYVRVAR